ncbi:uncharacterized protein [Pseudorca crassidens]|uniref:uncharacterized protein isoform X5 n=1 Tax=Pseudorca crassidens TaxID=82174 RepID=UPI00352EE809
MRWNFEEQHGNEILLLYLVGGENVPACMPTGTTFSRTVKPSVNYAVPPSSSEGVVSPAPGAHNFSGSRLQQCAERAVDDSFRRHLLSSSFGVAPQMKTLRKRKVKNLPMISYPSVQPVHKLHCPTPRSASRAIFNNSTSSASCVMATSSYAIKT